MAKKLITIFLFVLFAFFLFACSNNKLDLTQEMILSNVNRPYVEPDKYVSTVETVNLSNYIVVNEYLTQGLLIVRNDDFEQGVFSLSENRIIVPLLNHSISIISSPANGAYIYLTNTDNTKTIYDIAGRQIIDRDRYAQLNVTGYTENQYDEKGIYTGRKHFETIRYLTQDQIEAGNYASVEKTYEINLKTRERTEVDTSDKSYSVGEKIGEETLPLIDLKSHGLDNYFYMLTNDIYSVYDQNHNLVSQFRRPSSSNITAYSLFDGHIFYQTRTLVPESQEDYTYSLNGYKYILSTYSIDLLTGQKKSLDLDYIINSIIPFKNEDGILKYAQVEIMEIENQIITSDIAHKHLMNKDGDLLISMDGISVNQLTRLSDERLYDTQNRYMMTYDFKPLFKLEQNPIFNYQEEIIITTHDGKYGIIDYHGEVLVPFNYTQIHNLFSNGSTIAVRNGTEYCIISLTGDETCVPDFFSIMLPGLYITRTTETDYKFRFYDFDGKLLNTITSAQGWATSFDINNPYVDGQIINFSWGMYKSYVLVRYEETLTPQT